MIYCSLLHNSIPIYSITIYTLYISSGKHHSFFKGRIRVIVLVMVCAMQGSFLLVLEQHVCARKYVFIISALNVMSDLQVVVLYRRLDLNIYPCF